MIAFFVAATLVSGVAAITDHRTGHIPNGLTLGALAAALVSHLVHGVVVAGAMGGVKELGLSLAGALLAGLAPLVVFMRGGMGGGDVKLFAAIGALCLPLGGLAAESYAFAAAAVLAPAQLAYQGVLFRTLAAAGKQMVRPFVSRDRRAETPEELKVWFRLGPSIFVGCAVALLAQGGVL